MDFMNQFNDEAVQATFTKEEVEKNKVVCVLAYFWILFFLPFVSDKNSAYAKFHANQAFVFFIASIVVGVAGGILSIIPILGVLISAALSLAEFAAMVILMICASKGMAVRIPVIGNIEIFK